MYFVLFDDEAIFCFPSRVRIVICSSDVAYNSGINSIISLTEKLCHPFPKMELFALRN